MGARPVCRKHVLCTYLGWPQAPSYTPHPHGDHEKHYLSVQRGVRLFDSEAPFFICTPADAVIADHQSACVGSAALAIYPASPPLVW